MLRLLEVFAGPPDFAVGKCNFQVKPTLGGFLQFLVLPGGFPPHLLTLVAVDELHFLGFDANPFVIVLQETLEVSPPLAGDNSFPGKTAFQITKRLPISQFLRSELRALFAQMPSVTFAGKLLVRQDISATPTPVAALFVLPFTFLLGTGHRL
jgi:hypothetical protein